MMDEKGLDQAHVDYYENKLESYQRTIDEQYREIQQLKEALKELIPIAKDRLFSIPVKSLGDVEETIERVSKLI